MPAFTKPRLAFGLGLFAAHVCIGACHRDGPEPALGASAGSGIATAPVDEPGRDAAADSAADARTDADAEPEVEPPPDISTLHARTREAGPLGLTLDVSEKGPEQPWVVAVVNEGDEPVDVVADSRLLWFEVKVPGKRDKVTCRLPEAMFPASAEERLIVTLNPGEGVAEEFDPRLYCFAGGGQKALVPGAVVTPYFGWKKQTKPVWQRGRRRAPEQAPPFVATRPDREGDALTTEKDERARRDAKTSRAAAERPEVADGASPEERRLKLVEGQPFALRSEYKEWSSTRLREEEPLRQNPGPLDLVLSQGTDAHSDHSAILSLRLVNRSDRTQHVYFRRELVSFEVVGPEGVVTCDPEPDDRSPDRQAFTTLRKKGSISAASRLIELCPQDTFSEPGLYLVYARFDATEDGSRQDIDAFVGRAVSLSPALVRIRTGEVPFLQKQPMRLIEVKPKADAAKSDATKAGSKD